MREYVEIVRSVLERGSEKMPVRFDSVLSQGGQPTKVENTTIGLPHVVFQHRMSDGFPLLTTKRVSLRNIAVELEFFIKGLTDKRWLQTRGCKIWDDWSNPMGIPPWFNKDQVKEASLADPDLGPIYGYQWRTFGKPYIPPATVEPVEDVEAVTDELLRRALLPVWRALQAEAPRARLCHRWTRFSNFADDATKLAGWEATRYELVASSEPTTVLLRHYYHRQPDCATIGPRTLCWSSTPVMRVQRPEIDGRQYPDQLGTICERLRQNPMDRRMVCSAWSPSQIPEMGLPPCHYSWAVTTYGGELHLKWSQRSCDLMLGVPYNIASYGLLLCLLARHAGLQPGTLTGILEDCHIYTNHLTAAKDYLETRVPRQLPRLSLLDQQPGKFNLLDWEHTQYILHDYDPYPNFRFGDVTVV